MANAPTDGFLSNITVRWSALAVYSAQQHPAGPPPTIATSHSTSSIILSCVLRRRRSGRRVGARAEQLATKRSARRLGGRRRLALIGSAMAWRGAGARASIVLGWSSCAAAEACCVRFGPAEAVLFDCCVHGSMDGAELPGRKCKSPKKQRGPSFRVLLTRASLVSKVRVFSTQKVKLLAANEALLQPFD